MQPLFEAILGHVPPPIGDPNKPLQLQVTTLDYSDYLGRIVIGRIHNGTIKAGQQAILLQDSDQVVKGKITKLMGFEGLARVELEEATAGMIVAVAGFADANIGETIACPDEPQALPLIKVDEPTLQMTFLVNDSPLRRPRRAICHLSPTARSPNARIRDQRGPARRTHRLPRQIRRLRTR